MKNNLKKIISEVLTESAKLNNITQNLVDYYSSDDFKSNYADALLEDTHYVSEKIKDMWKSYEFEKQFPKIVEMYPDGPNQVQIDDLLYVLNDSEYVVDAFAMSWSPMYIDGVMFGEQEEDISEYVERFGRDSVVQSFEDADFVISGDYAYYNLSYDGIAIDFSLLSENDIIEIMEKWE